MSKTRPVDPRQPDLFEAPAGVGPGTGEASDGGAFPDPVGDGVAHGDGAPVDLGGEDAAGVAVGVPVVGVGLGEVERPRFCRVEPGGFRAAGRGDGYLYCVATREVADRMLRDALADGERPPLVERGGVVRQMAAVADELGWSDEQPGAIVVLRVRRGEVEGSEGAGDGMVAGEVALGGLRRRAG